MSTYKYIAQFMQRSPVSCAAVYVLIMFALVVTGGVLIADLQNQRTKLASATDLLKRLQRRSLPADFAADSGARTGVTTGSAFLAGQTVTVAGANLLERVSKAIATAGGRVVSSQVDLQSTRANPGLASVIINCEIDQLSLQKLLFDLEAGLPFLFIDQLEIQAPDLSSGSQTSAMHVILTASAQWLGKQ